MPMNGCTCTDPPCNAWSPDCEQQPRNAAAIRTAIMLGAEYHREPRSKMWSIKGVDFLSERKTMPAWLFVSCHGLGIDHDAKPVKLGDIG